MKKISDFIWGIICLIMIIYLIITDKMEYPKEEEELYDVKYL